MNENLNLTDDVVQPFQLESSHLRGRLVRLGPALDTILRQHEYQLPVARLLGEAVVIASALATSLKYEGVFTLQAKGDGAVRMIVVDVTSDGDIRGYAQLAEGVRTFAPNPTGDARLLGKGYLAFTVDQKKKDDRYQGIVELAAGTLAEAVQHYFRQSEQIPTGIVAAARQDEQGRWRGGCLMLQRMPRARLRQGYGEVLGSVAPKLEERRRKGGIPPVRGEDYTGEVSEDDWLRAMLLMDTCGVNELTHASLKPNDLLFRLFHEEGVRVFDPHPFRQKCRCSEDRVTNMLRSLPRDEIETMAVNGVVSVTCEFCNRTYVYDEKQRSKLWV